MMSLMLHYQPGSIVACGCDLTNDKLPWSCGPEGPGRVHALQHDKNRVR